MTTSSQHQEYSTILGNVSIDSNNITLDDTITLTPGSITLPSSWSWNQTTPSASTITISDFSNEYQINWGATEFVNAFPDWDRIENMCKEYPGLKIAFEKFKTTYYLVKDDYDTPKTEK